MNNTDIEQARKELEGADPDICLVLAHLIEITNLLREMKYEKNRDKTTGA